MASNNNWGNRIPDAKLLLGNQANTTAPAELDLIKTRAGAVVQNGDGLGSLFFYADDGAAAFPGLEVGRIRLVSNGAVAGGSVPADMQFYTFGAVPAADTQRMVIASTGAVTINAPDGAAVGLTIAGGGLSVTGATASGALTVTGALVQSAGNITLNNDAAGATILIGTGAAAKLVTIGSANSTSSLLLQAGTGDVNIQSQDDINIGANAVAQDIVIGNSTGNTSLNLNVGTGALNVGANAIAHTVTIGNITGATAVNLNSGTGGIALVSTGSGDITAASADTLLLDSAGVLELNSSAGVISIGNDAVAQNINIGTGAAARVITIGNVSGASQVVLNSGTAGVAINTTGAGDFLVNSADTALIDSAGVLELNSSAGVISIGNDAVNQNINLGSAGARVITIGNVSGATGIAQLVGTGNFSLDGVGASTYTFAPSTTGGTINFGGTGANTGTMTIAGGTGAQTLNIANSTGGKTVNLASGAGANAVVVGSTNSTSALTLQAGTGATGLKLSAAGNVQMVPATDSQASPSATSTINNRVGVATFTGFTTAAAGTQDFTIANNTVLATSGVMVHVANLNASTNGAQMSLVGVTQAASSLIVHTKNNGGGALGAGDNVLITFWVIS